MIYYKNVFGIVCADKTRWWWIIYNDQLIKDSNIMTDLDPDEMGVKITKVELQNELLKIL